MPLGGAGRGSTWRFAGNLRRECARRERKDRATDSKVVLGVMRSIISNTGREERRLFMSSRATYHLDPDPRESQMPSAISFAVERKRLVKNSARSLNEQTRVCGKVHKFVTSSGLAAPSLCRRRRLNSDEQCIPRECTDNHGAARCIVADADRDGEEFLKQSRN